MRFVSLYRFCCLISLTLYWSCGTYDLKINPKVKQAVLKPESEILHTFYLISEPSIKKMFPKSLDKTKNTILFLNDTTTTNCAFEVKPISDQIIVLDVNSHWYLENWNLNPTRNQNCTIKTRSDFFLQLENEIRKHPEKIILIHMPHQLLSDGASTNIFQTISGLSPDEIQNKNNRELRNRMASLYQISSNIIYLSGREHNLQYLTSNHVKQIISGARENVTKTKRSLHGEFSVGALGYTKLFIYKNGDVQASFLEKTPNNERVLYNADVLSQKTDPKSYSTTFPKSIQKAIYPDHKIKNNALYTQWLGDHYRNAYRTLIEATCVNLDTLYGGLKPLFTGGGNSNKLRLQSKNGKTYEMIPLKKDIYQLLQNSAYQEKFNIAELEGTFLENFIEDVYTTSHPFASTIIPSLSKAIDVLYTKPELFYIPKQKALGNHNATYGDDLYFIQESVDNTHLKASNFGKPNQIISTADLFTNLQTNPTHTVDQKAYVRARLFDLLLGDWDKGPEQWKWAAFKQNKSVTYKPIPLHRDQVFSDYDGIFWQFLSKIVPELKNLQLYDYQIINLKNHLKTSFPVDLKIITNLSLDDFYTEAFFIRQQLTDERIDEAFQKLPIEIQTKKIEEVKKILQYRRDHLNKIAKQYHNLLLKNVVLTASNSDDVIEVNYLNNKETSITFNTNNKPYFTAIYQNKNTKNIWIYGLAGNDDIRVIGKSKKGIHIKIIGGEGADYYDIHDQKKTTIIDQKQETNILFHVTDTKTTLTDNYNTNAYDYLKRKQTLLRFLPLVGSNPDDGFFAGFTTKLAYKDLIQKPFTHQHTLKAAYYTLTSGYDVYYKGVQATWLENFRLFTEFNFTSANYANNFFGYGNDLPKKAFALDYYRYKLATYSGAIGISKIGRQGGEIDLKISAESKQIAQLPNRLLSTYSQRFFGVNSFIGIENKIEYQNYDNIVFPTTGVQFMCITGVKANTNYFYKNFGYVIPSFSITHPLNKSKRLVLASKLKAHLIIGNEGNLEIYQMSTLGGDDGLRGFNNERFTGKQSAYFSTDIRYNFRKLKSGIAPLNLGFFGGFDAGRVWIENDSSDKIHTSFGGGIWLKAADLITGQTGVFFSNDGPRFTVGLGFEF